MTYENDMNRVLIETSFSKNSNLSEGDMGYYRDSGLLSLVLFQLHNTSHISAEAISLEKLMSNNNSLST